MKETHWHNIDTEKILKSLSSSIYGLTQKKAEEKLRSLGLNQLPEKKKLSNVIIFLSQFKSPLVYILLIASCISFFLRHYIDVAVILVIVVINSIIGYIQEAKANEALYFLKKAITFNARVFRDGHEIEIDTKFLVLGDIVLLKAGDRVPADIRLIEIKNLSSVEASLTGESTESRKNTKILPKGTPLADRENMVFMGTSIIKGKAKGVVVQSGSHTELGKIATLVKETRESLTPLQLNLKKFSRSITLIVIFISFAIFILGWLSGEENILYTVVALAVAAIPEGMLIAVTVVLAIGMRAILKKNALIRKLIATETLGSTSVICTDKTGTITEGKMRVVSVLSHEDIFDFKSSESRHKDIARSIFTITTLCNNAVIVNPNESLQEWEILGDSIDAALLVASKESGINQDKLGKEFPRIDEVPFDTDIKYMATLHHLDDSHNILYVKGAPEKILSFSSFFKTAKEKKKLDSQALKKLKEKYESLTAKGIRVLACAEKTVEKNETIQSLLNNLTFIGFIGFKDPIRKEAKEAFSLTQIAGIKTVVVTGDHRLTAVAIVSEMGLKVTEQNTLLGDDLDRMSDKELDKIVENITVFARVNPSHKIRIVQAWQRKGDVVAMTGDGVNDAPAIKAADIGISLNSGTDVAKETSDVVLLDNNFKTIVEAIKQGRIIFDNIRKVIVFLISDSFCIVTLIIVSIVFGFPLPILPLQILWVNLIVDGLPAMALTLESGEEDIIKEKPRKKNEPILNKKTSLFIFHIAITLNILAFIILLYLLRQNADIQYIRTMVFTFLALNTLFSSLSIRNFRKSIFSKNIFSNKYLLGSVIFGVFLQAIAIYEPHLKKIFQTVSLSLQDLLLLSLNILVFVFTIEIGKYFIVRTSYKKIK